MQVLEAPSNAGPRLPGPPRRFVFTADAFHEMARTGLLGEDHSRLELLNGEIFELMPIGQRHAATVDRLNRVFSRNLPDLCLVRVQNPIRISRVSEPLPDISIVRGSELDFLKSPPCPEDTLLIVEVSDTTLSHDIGDKARAYARAGILEYWVIDLESSRLRIFRDPDGEEFRQIRIVAHGDTVSLGSLPELEFQVADLLLPA
jgi:Uma2 family endonuclease